MEDLDEWERRGEENKQEPRLPASQAQMPKENVKWKRPMQNWVKCNTDAAWPKEGTKCGIGWVLRNDSGRVLWLGVRALPRTRTVMEAEAEALRWAILTMSRFQYKKVIFESDAQELIKLLNSGEGWPHLNPIIQDIQSLLPAFEDVRFVFSQRGGNKVADRIARESISFENYDPKLYSIVPRWLNPTVELDLEL